MFYRCNRVDLRLSSSKQKLVVVCRVLPSHSGNHETELWHVRSGWHEQDCRQSRSDFWGNNPLWSIWWQIFKSRRNQTSSFFLLCKELCYNVQQLCALTPAFKISVTAGFRRNISASQTDENEEPSSIGFSRRRAAACLHDRVKSPTRTIDWKKNTIFLKWIVYLMAACGLYNRWLVSIEEADMFVPKITQYVRKQWGHLFLTQALILTLSTWALV